VPRRHGGDARPSRPSEYISARGGRSTCRRRSGSQLMDRVINTDLTHNVTPPFDLTYSQLEEAERSPPAGRGLRRPSRTCWCSHVSHLRGRNRRDLHSERHGRKSGNGCVHPEDAIRSDLFGFAQDTPRRRNTRYCTALERSFRSRVRQQRRNHTLALTRNCALSGRDRAGTAQPECC
jgi:hypothetical protein